MTAPGQIFETERAVIDGVEMTVWKHAPANLRQVLDLSLGHGERDFLVYEGQRFTFEEHYRAAATFARRLGKLGVAKGDRVVIAARNLPQWVIAFWGVVVAGAVAVPLNAWWTGEELAYGLSDSGAIVAVVDEERLARVRPHLDELDFLGHVTVIAETPGRAASLGEPHDRVAITDFDALLGPVDVDAVPPALDLAPDDDATMFYTSGTTGHPKGAVGTHRNAITNMMNMFFIGQRAMLRFGTGNVDEQGASVPNSFLLNVPLFHATGCLAVMIVNTAAGGKLVMTHHFDAGQALELIARERISSFGGVPTIAMQVLDHPDFASYDTSSVRSVSYGGAPAPPELVKRIRSAFPAAQPGNGYGLTETSAGIALNNGPDYVERPTSCGTAVPVCEVAIVPEGYAGQEPPADRPRGPEVVGELWVKGPNVVKGYWHKPEATAESFTRGWLHTGDIARVDDEGFIYIVDRAKDVIIRGGENVYSVMVESAIFEHPDIADCAVVGLPHPTLGEEVAAVVVLRPGRAVEAAEITRHVAERLGRFEVPTKLFFRAAPLPRNPQGKVLKRELRASLLEAN
ncbi:MAG: acyl--CoA ligase [Acidobacteriota bacterium]|nr:acyl--CoA ligase [Acidobacteriota bacterium]